MASPMADKNTENKEETVPTKKQISPNTERKIYERYSSNVPFQSQQQINYHHDDLYGRYIKTMKYGGVTLPQQVAAAWNQRSTMGAPPNQNQMYQKQRQNQMYQKQMSQNQMYQKPATQSQMYQKTANQSQMYQKPANQSQMYQKPANQNQMYQNPYQNSSNQPVQNQMQSSQNQMPVQDTMQNSQNMMQQNDQNPMEQFGQNPMMQFDMRLMQQYDMNALQQYNNMASMYGNQFPGTEQFNQTQYPLGGQYQNQQFNQMQNQQFPAQQYSQFNQAQNMQQTAPNMNLQGLNNLAQYQHMATTGQPFKVATDTQPGKTGNESNNMASKLTEDNKDNKDLLSRVMDGIGNKLLSPKVKAAVPVCNAFEDGDEFTPFQAENLSKRLC